MLFIGERGSSERYYLFRRQNVCLLFIVGISNHSGKRESNRQFGV